MHSKQLKYGPVAILAGFASSDAFGVGGQSYSNSLSDFWDPSP